MTTSSLTTEWLKDNDAQRSASKKRRAPKRRRMVAIDPLDLKAFDRLAEMEKNTSHTRRGRGRFNKNKYLKLPVKSFLVDHLDFDGLECLLIPGAIPGRMPSVDGSPASRAMCAMCHGGAGEEWVARHLCGNGHIGCVNPAHLRWGSHLQNMRDRELHRQVPAFWPELTEEQIADIQDDPRHLNIVAVEYNVHAAVVRDIRQHYPPR